MAKRRRRNPTNLAQVAAKSVAAGMDKRTQSLLVGALMDLHNGPFSKADMKAQGIANWPGYEKAIKHLEDWAYDIGGVWVDPESDDVSDNEPRPWVVVGPSNEIEYVSFDKNDAQDQADYLSDDSGDEYDVSKGSGEDAGYVYVDGRDIKRAIFGTLISDGGMKP